MPEVNMYWNKKVLVKTTDYRLSIKIDYENKKVISKCGITLHNPTDKPINEVPLMLYRLLKVKTIKDNQDNEIPFNQQVISYEDDDALQVNYIQILLKEPMLQDDIKILNIEYEGYLFGYTETGMMYIKDRVDRNFTIIREDCKAYPIVAYPSWKSNRISGFQNFSYNIEVIVPEFLIVANGGKLISKHSWDGFTKYTYENIKPSWRIDIAVAPYEVLQDESAGLKIFYFEKDRDGAERVLQAFRGALEFYSENIGELNNVHNFTVIEIPKGYGSQTDVNCILQTSDAFQSVDNLTGLYHEIAHFWDHRMLDPLPCRVEQEGRAEFLQFLIQEKLDKKPYALKEGYKYICDRSADAFKAHPQAAAIPIADYGKHELTYFSYTVGMMFFYYLYKLVGEESFFNFLGTYYREYKETGAALDDFICTLKRVSPVNLDKFINDWLYSCEPGRYILDGMQEEEIINIYKNDCLPNVNL